MPVKKNKGGRQARRIATTLSESAVWCLYFHFWQWNISKFLALSKERCHAVWVAFFAPFRDLVYFNVLTKQRGSFGKNGPEMGNRDEWTGQKSLFPHSHSSSMLLYHFMTDLTDWTRRMVWYQTKDRVTVPDIVSYTGGRTLPLVVSFYWLWAFPFVSGFSSFVLKETSYKTGDSYMNILEVFLRKMKSSKMKVDWDNEKTRIYAVTETKIL